MKPPVFLAIIALLAAANLVAIWPRPVQKAPTQRAPTSRAEIKIIEAGKLTYMIDQKDGSTYYFRTMLDDKGTIIAAWWEPVTTGTMTVTTAK